MSDFFSILRKKNISFISYTNSGCKGESDVPAFGKNGEDDDHEEVRSDFALPYVRYGKFEEVLTWRMLKMIMISRGSFSRKRQNKYEDT